MAWNLLDCPPHLLTIIILFNTIKSFKLRVVYKLLVHLGSLSVGTPRCTRQRDFWRILDKSQTKCYHLLDVHKLWGPSSLVNNYQSWNSTVILI